jgi:hypothetical protein
MNAKDVTRYSLDQSQHIMDAYLGDLDDADLLIRPVEGMNHIAWQLGHLIQTERMIVESLKPGSSPPLPDGFEVGHGRQEFGKDDASAYLPRAKYQELWKAQRTATKAVLDSLPDSELDKPSPEPFRKIAPTVGTMLNLAGTHPLLHAGQFVSVRRKLKKPVTI